MVPVWKTLSPYLALESGDYEAEPLDRIMKFPRRKPSRGTSARSPRTSTLRLHPSSCRQGHRPSPLRPYVQTIRDRPGAHDVDRVVPAPDKRLAPGDEEWHLESSSSREIGLDLGTTTARRPRGLRFLLKIS